MIDFEVNIEADFIKRISTFKKDFEKATQSVLRKTAKQVEEEVAKIVSNNKLIDMDLKTMRKTKAIRRVSDLKSGIDQMNIKISFTANKHPSYRYFPNYLSLSKKKVWMGRMHGKAKLFYQGKAFLPKGLKTLVYREDDSRYPLAPVFGPSLGSLLETGNYMAPLRDMAERKLKENLLAKLGDDLKFS